MDRTNACFTQNHPYLTKSHPRQLPYQASSSFFNHKPLKLAGHMAGKRTAGSSSRTKNNNGIAALCDRWSKNAVFGQLQSGKPPVKNIVGAEVVEPSRKISTSTEPPEKMASQSSLLMKEVRNERLASFISDDHLFKKSHSSDQTTKDDDKGTYKGLGIVEFLKDKNILITGATGFLAKVLVEKIFRVQPEIGQIYLLIKAEDVNSAEARLENEILNVELFQCLQRQYGSNYQAFMRKKITPVVGDITKENLGIEKNMIKELKEKLHVIINSAANTSFDERYDVALNTNTQGAQRVLELGKMCSHLQLFLHVSTAFVNGERKGRVIEKPFKMGQSIARERFGPDIVPDVNLESELDLVKKIIDETCSSAHTMACNVEGNKKEMVQLLKNVGLQRARLFGWQDTYVFSKAMGEMVINKLRGQIPVVILRPSVIESSLNEPFAGWMEGNRMMDPIVIAYGKGQLEGFVGDPNGVLDVVPVDMVANVTLAAIAKHASTPGLEVYHVASSVVNPLILENLAKSLHKHFSTSPYVDRQGKPVKPEEVVFFENMEGLMSSICEAYQRRSKSATSHERGGKLSKRESLIILNWIKQANYLANIYKPYTFYAGRFDNSNTEKLYSELSSEEREMFKFDVREIDWENYINSVHIPGLRKYVMKERGTNTN